MFFAGILTAQQITPQPIIQGQWLKSWLLCGPIPAKEPKDAADSWDHLFGFNNDYLQKAGGEQHPIVKAGDVVKFTKGSAKWKLYNSPDSIIDLVRVVSKASPVFAYAYTEVLSDENKVWFISLGSNDGGKLLVNGVNVWDYPQARGLVTGDDVIPVMLKKGKNTLLFKIEQRGNQWGFCARFLPFSTANLAERGELFTISTDENGESEITSKFTSPVLEQLIQNVNIEILNNQNQPVLKEQRATNFCG
ncbi:MAG TPA: hypothetical protein VFC67_07260, partial [Prolixibacteraceae bacterium]|nr:hypothetical protein [Prolixibacteraceae bacterium]